MSANPIRRRLVAAALAAVALVTIALPSGDVLAQEPSAPAAADGANGSTPTTQPAPGGGPSLTFDQLGLGPSVTVTGSSGSRFLDIPVPDGMTVASLNATVRTSNTAGGGALEVRSQDVTVASVELPPGGRANVSLAVPLGGAPVERDVVRVELVAHLDATEDGVCAALFTAPQAILSNGTVTYAGTPAPPRTIGEFLPPVLTRLDIVVPETYSPQQAQASLRLATNVAMQYGPQRPEIQVHSTAPPPSAPSPFHRTIELDVDQPGIAVLETASGPVLRVGGDGSTLSQQIDLLTSQLDRLAVVDSAAVTLSQPVTQEMVRGRRTVAALGFGDLHARGVGRIDISIPFSQSDLGGPTTSITAELLGTTTPVPAGASASIAVLLNDVVIASQALDTSGSFNLRVGLPNHLVTRDNDLVLQVDYTPVNGLCDVGAQQMTVQLDPSSMISGSNGTSLPPGFVRFPQAFLPTFTVALGTLDIRSLEVATDLVVSLQQLSSRLMRPEVQPWATAVSSSAPTLLVGQENVDFDEALRPPLSLLTVDGVQATTERLQLAMDGEVAAIQAFNVGSRDIVLATWQGNQDLLVRLARSVVDSEGGWRELTGDAVVMGPLGEPEALALRAPQPGTTIDIPKEEGLLSSSRLLVGALVLVLAAVAVIALWAWARRRGKGADGTPDPTPESTVDEREKPDRKQKDPGGGDR